MLFRGLIGCVIGSIVTLVAPARGDAPAIWRPDAAETQRIPEMSGRLPDGIPQGVSVQRKQETLGDPACFRFDAEGAYIEIPDAPALNPAVFTVTLWFSQAAEYRGEQRPLLVKSAPAHVPPWYQYGVFALDTAEHPGAVAAVVNVGGTLVSAEAVDIAPEAGWLHLAAVYDGVSLRVYVNGVPKAETAGPGGAPVAYPTPLLFGAYGNLPKTSAYCFRGGMGPVALYGRALSGEEILAAYDAEKGAYPVDNAADPFEGDAYAARLNEALRQPRDVWGEALIAGGGATYENIQGYLRPLFYSTGFKNTEPGPHNLLFALDGGPEPYLVPLANGRRIAANIITLERFLDVSVGEAGEGYGGDLTRLHGPDLEGEYYPILRTEYDGGDGVRYTQESFGASVPGVDHIVACVRFTAHAGGRIRVQVGGPPECLHWSGEAALAKDALEWKPASGAGETAEWYLLWSPETPLPDDAVIAAARYDELKAQCKAYWEARLAAGAHIAVPEPLAMDCMRNLLIQNLMMRWRYSMGAVVYSGSFYQPESNDAMTTLGHYGYTAECLDGISTLNELVKERKDHYTNWEHGEKLTHGAQAYFLTRNAEVVAKNTPLYEQYCRDLVQQMAESPVGLLRPERECGDVPEVGYYAFHQAVCWRGMRDMAEVWRMVGRDDLHAAFAPAAAQLRATLLARIAACQQRLPDGSLFIPRVLEPGAECYDPVTETRLGSYWNLIMPYAFDSGLWAADSPEMDGIVQFMHEHGSMLLGLLRFNYYPVPIGKFRRDGLPGYWTTGFDNVYLPSYERMMADRDDAERLILSFYGKLAHGQTRGTFVSGEGDSVGPRPGEYYRSCYGSPCSANNAAFLTPLRLMLMRESFNTDTGAPENLYLAHATPRGWLEDGKRIVVEGAPTCFGPVSFEIQSHLSEGRIEATVHPPDRNPIRRMYLRIRAPHPYSLSAVTVNGAPWERFAPETGTIELSGMAGECAVTCLYK